MPGAVDRFVGRAEEQGLSVAPRAFPEGTRTAQDAAAAIGCDVAQIVKSLIFMADGQPVLVLTSGRNRVDEAALATFLGAREVRKADAAEARQATGYAIGGTPPLGHDGALRILCDPALLAYDEVWAAAGTPQHVFPIPPAQLVAVTRAEVVDVTAR